jgi:hypothetical protein
MKRADFLKAMAALGAAAWVGCGDDDADEPTTSGPSQGAGGGTTTTTGSGAGSTTAASGTGGAGVGGGGTGGGSATCPSDIDAQITCRHNHSLIVTTADIIAGQDKTYDIRGTSNHGHNVTVTAAMFAELAAGMTVEIFVPSAIQPHTVFLSCAADVDPNALDDEQCN